MCSSHSKELWVSSQSLLSNIKDDKSDSDLRLQLLLPIPQVQKFHSIPSGEKYLDGT